MFQGEGLLDRRVDLEVLAVEVGQALVVPEQRPRVGLVGRRHVMVFGNSLACGQ